MKKLLLIIILATILLVGCVPKQKEVALEDNNQTIEDIKEEPIEEKKEEPPATEETPREEAPKQEVKETPKTETKPAAKEQTSVAVAPKTTVTTPPVVEETPEEETPIVNEEPKEEPPVEEPKEEPVIDEPKGNVISDILKTYLDKSIPNNGKYKVNYTTLNGTVPYGMYYIIENYQGEQVAAISSFANGTSGPSKGADHVMPDGRYKGFLSIPGWESASGTVDMYIFITSNGTTYCEKAVFTITN